MPRRRVLPALLCLLVFAAATAAQAAPRESAPDGKDLKRAAAVLSKLRRVEGPAASGDHEAFARAARKLYPGLFAAVAKLRDGDLKTELATAVALYEAALRASGGGGAAPDCSRELRAAYSRLCTESTGGDRARLLRAKALMHARRAEAALLHARGDRAPLALDAMRLIRAERTTDRALAEEALHELKDIAAELGGDDPPPATGVRRAHAAGSNGRSPEALRGRFEQLERLLASLPHDRAARLLRDARDAFRDGLYWRLKSGPALARVVNASSFAEPGALPRLGLRADDAERAALANLRAGLKFISRAEEALRMMNAGQ